MFGGRKQEQIQFNLLCKSEISAEKVKSKRAHFILIVRDVFVALAVVVAKAPYIHESDSSILVLLQTRMIKCEKVSR